MFQQELIERAALHLEGLWLARETTLAKDELDKLRSVAEMKLSTDLLDESGRLEGGENPELFEQLSIIRQQRFADVKARKMFLFEQQHSPALARQEPRRGTAAWPAADH